MREDEEKSPIMQQIDENLRRVYREVETGDVPDRFKLLLDRLRDQDKAEDEK
jgi:hypothetical protein